jgi:hypothetical protein
VGSSRPEGGLCGRLPAPAGGPVWSQPHARFGCCLVTHSTAGAQIETGHEVANRRNRSRPEHGVAPEGLLQRLQGYRGSKRTVRRQLAGWRLAEPPPPAHAMLPGPRTLVWLLLRRPSDLDKKSRYC